VLFEQILFFVAAIGALGGALGVVLLHNPFYSVLSLIAHLVSLAILFLLLRSEFLAAAQIVVYAGAIMVLFLFVLMLLNVRPEERFAGESLRFKLTALALGAVLVAQVAMVLVNSPQRPLAAGFDASSRPVARILFSPHYLYVFEATSVLILSALVGAVALARKEE